MKKDKETEARNWFTQARAEFEDAIELEKRKRFYIALFLYQQSSEKALKAFLFFHVHHTSWRFLDLCKA